jgi:hypothetical protein
MDIVIEIDTKTIYDEVYAVTSHTGRAAGNIDAISLSEDEIKIIDPFMKESVYDLSDVISSYGNLSIIGDTILISFSLPPNWKDNKNALIQCIRNYISNSICKKWFSMTNKDDVIYYSERVILNSNNIKKILCERIRPKR